MSDYPHKCQNCGSPCYTGCTTILCSNPACLYADPALPLIAPEDEWLKLKQKLLDFDPAVQRSFDRGAEISYHPALCYITDKLCGLGGRLVDSRRPRPDLIRLDERRLISRRMIGRVELKQHRIPGPDDDGLTLFIYGQTNVALEVVRDKEDRERVMEEFDEGA